MFDVWCPVSVQESCKKCVFYREGVPELETLFMDLCIGKAYQGILEEIEELSSNYKGIAVRIGADYCQSGFNHAERFLFRIPGSCQRQMSRCNMQTIN